MFRNLLGLITILILVSACEPATQAVAITGSTTATSSQTPTATRKALPTATPTASITPLPTIPTFTPTFDVSTIVTVTPAPKAECPPINPTIKPEGYLPKKIEIGFFNIADKILDYLNNGGDGQLLLERLNKIYPKGDLMGGYDFRDLTGDQIAEFLYIEFQTGGKPFIFSCENGKFEKLATLSGSRDHLAYDVEIDDLNIDGIPEVVITGTSGASLLGSTIYLYEWNGQTFSIMGQASILALRQTQIEDLDGDGTKEISFSGDNPTCSSCSSFIPQRQRTITYSWNGKEFVEISNEFNSPEYRFQAIQDADSAVMVGKYDKALRSYEKAIANKELEWWSPERMQYERDTYVWFPDITPPAIPLGDKAEYPRLAAYDYYRIMLLHLVQGHESDATTAYNTLQEKFGNDAYGHPYVEMATAFWNAYQSTHKMYDSCAAAIEYAAEHPDILIPLGSDYHGSQSHIYKPEDVCPFR